jgi:hypothetical protein
MALHRDLPREKFLPIVLQEVGAVDESGVVDA